MYRRYIPAMLTIPAVLSADEEVRLIRRPFSMGQRRTRTGFSTSGHNADQRTGINATLERLLLNRLLLQQISFLELDNMAFEEEIDSRLPYRIGYPKLPVLPVDLRDCAQSIETYLPDNSDLGTRICHILDKYQIPLTTTRFGHRVHHGIDDVAGRFPTLVLVSTYEHDNCQDQWVKAVNEIRMGLTQSGIDLAIELIDHRVFFGLLHTSPVSSTDRNLIEGWSKVLPDFLNIMEKQTRNWVAIDVLYQEFPSRELQPTVVISARDADDDTWWDQTLPALHQLLRDNDLKVDIELRFLQDLTLTMTESAISEDRTQPNTPITEGGTEPSHSITKDFYSDTIHMGTSCATSGSDRTGTLGGRLKLQKASSILELGLTNYHVLRDAFIDRGSSVGPFPPDLGQPYKTAVTPSNRDHKAAIQDMRVSLHEAEEQYRDYSQKLSYLTEDDPSWERTSSRARVQSLKQKALEAQLEMAENDSRHIGCIYAASGLRTRDNPRYRNLMQHEHWALDWCLVQVDEPKSISCELRNVPSTTHYIRNEDEVTQYCSISGGVNYKVVKKGRTTGWTSGTLSSIDSIICLRDHHIPELRIPTYQKVEFKEKWCGKPVFVHTIMGLGKTPQFLEPGDSGSLILLDEASNLSGASIIGLGFAANDATRASYMIPMDLVVRDIEVVTGAKVVEPKYVGEALVASDQ